MECGSDRKYVEKKCAPLPISHRRGQIYFAIESGDGESFMLLM
jgi:hypothetical protein